MADVTVSVLSDTSVTFTIKGSLDMYTFYAIHVFLLTARKCYFLNERKCYFLNERKLKTVARA